jgi:hypothetical protein
MGRDWRSSTKRSIEAGVKGVFVNQLETINKHQLMCETYDCHTTAGVNALMAISHLKVPLWVNSTYTFSYCHRTSVQQQTPIDGHKYIPTYCHMFDTYIWRVWACLLIVTLLLLHMSVRVLHQSTFSLCRNIFLLHQNDRFCLTINYSNHHDTDTLAQSRW